MVGSNGGWPRSLPQVPLISIRSRSSLTRLSTKRARWPSATKSCTLGGRNSGSSIFQARNVLLMRRERISTRASLASKIRYYSDRLLGAQWVAGQQRHRIVQMVAGNFECFATGDSP